MCVGFYLFIYLFTPKIMVCIFQGQSSKQFEKCYIIPGREIPKWFEKVNVCDTSVVLLFEGEPTTYKTMKVKIQLPGSGCDQWRGIVLCVVFLPTKRHPRQRDPQYSCIRVGGCQMISPRHMTVLKFSSEHVKVESHHLWLHSVSKNHFRLPQAPGCSIDKKGFHNVELEIGAEGLEVEEIGFCVV